MTTLVTSGRFSVITLDKEILIFDCPKHFFPSHISIPNNSETLAQVMNEAVVCKRFRAMQNVGG